MEAQNIGRNVLFGHLKPHNRHYIYTDNSFRYGLLKDFEELGITDHVLHDGQHTFSTMAKESGMDDYARKKFMWHDISDLTDRVYTHLDLEWFRTEIRVYSILSLTPFRSAPIHTMFTFIIIALITL